jgi:hypothetical protein
MRRQSEKNRNNTKRPRNTSSIDFPLLGSGLCLMPVSCAAGEMAMSTRIMNQMYQVVVGVGIGYFLLLILLGMYLSRRLWLKYVSSKWRRYFQSRSPYNVKFLMSIVLFSWFIKNKVKLKLKLKLLHMSLQLKYNVKQVVYYQSTMLNRF